MKDGLLILIAFGGIAATVWLLISAFQKEGRFNAYMKKQYPDWNKKESWE